MKLALNLLGVAVFALMLVPQGAEAYSYSVDYSANTRAEQQELITYLLQLVAQLQAQLGEQHGGIDTDIDVETVGADDIDENSASLFGNVDLNGASSARVWFEYGESTSFGERSLTGTARSGGEYTFRADVTGLDEGEDYYFRAVAEGAYGGREYGSTESFETDGYSDDDDDDDSDDNEPEATTDEADDIDGDSAELSGEVDMNDFEDGFVFFAYGQDEDLVEEIEDEYDAYDYIDEDGDDLQVFSVDSGLDGDEEYTETVDGLEEGEDYFFQICVEYEDEDDDETITCGGVEEFEADEDGNDDDDDDDEHPEVWTDSAEDVEEDEAELHGEVEMNDFSDGLVFFVYGEDEDLVEEIEDEYETYDDIDEEGEDLEKVEMDNGLDGNSTYEFSTNGLEEDTEYFFQICVEYEDEDDDDVIRCGGVEDFETEN